MRHSHGREALCAPDPGDCRVLRLTRSCHATCVLCLSYEYTRFTTLSSLRCPPTYLLTYGLTLKLSRWCTTVSGLYTVSVSYTVYSNTQSVVVEHTSCVVHTLPTSRSQAHAHTRALSARSRGPLPYSAAAHRCVRSQHACPLPAPSAVHAWAAWDSLHAFQRRAVRAGRPDRYADVTVTLTVLTRNPRLRGTESARWRSIFKRETSNYHNSVSRATPNSIQVTRNSLFPGERYFHVVFSSAWLVLLCRCPCSPLRLPWRRAAARSRLDLGSISRRHSRPTEGGAEGARQGEESAEG